MTAEAEGFAIRCGMPGSTEPMSGLGDLARFLGGDESTFIGEVLKLAVKAQATPEHMERLTLAFPDYLHAWRIWNNMSPIPTADRLAAELVARPSRSGTVVVVEPLTTGALLLSCDGCGDILWRGEAYDAVDVDKLADLRDDHRWRTHGEH